jgi:general stress protein 26
MEKQTAKRLSLELMGTTRFVFVSTLNQQNQPEIRAMNNLRKKRLFSQLPDAIKECRDNFVTFFSTLTSSCKVMQIRQEPRASLYYCRTYLWRGLMLDGRLEIVNDMSVKRELWQSDWTRYYPKGVEDPIYTILKFKGERAKYYHRLDLTCFEIEEKT